MNFLQKIITVMVCNFISQKLALVYIHRNGQEYRRAFFNSKKAHEYALLHTNPEKTVKVFSVRTSFNKKRIYRLERKLTWR